MNFYLLRLFHIFLSVPLYDRTKQNKTNENQIETICRQTYNKNNIFECNNWHASEWESIIWLLLQWTINFWRAACQFDSYSVGGQLMIAHIFLPPATKRASNRTERWTFRYLCLKILYFSFISLYLSNSNSKNVRSERQSLRINNKKWAFLLLHTNFNWISMFFFTFFLTLSPFLHPQAHLLSMFSSSHTYFRK